MRSGRYGSVRLLAPLAVLLCVVIAACGASNIVDQGESRGGGMKESKGSEIVELTPQGSALEYVEPDAKNRGLVSVSLPQEYECSESVEVYKATDDAQIELPTTTVRLRDADFSLQITVDDAGYLDWWCNGAVSEYIARAKAERFNSSWPISVDGREGVVLVQGSANAGGEISGDAFVFLDGTTVWFSAIPVDGEVPEADAYSKFFRSTEVCNLLDSVSLSDNV